MLNWKGFGRYRSLPNYKALSRHSPGGTEENHEKRQSGLSPGRDLNLGSPEYEAGVLTTQPRLSVPGSHNGEYEGDSLLGSAVYLRIKYSNVSEVRSASIIRAIIALNVLMIEVSTHP
jgi:hypothetical protein